jgi:hypothetical protein
VPPKLRLAKTEIQQHRALVWILTAVNLALTLIAITAVVQMEEGRFRQHPDEWAEVIMLFLLFCSSLGLLTCIFCLAGGGQGYSMRRFKGLAPLILMLLPVLVLLALIAVHLTVSLMVDFWRTFATG